MILPERGWYTLAAKLKCRVHCGARHSEIDNSFRLEVEFATKLDTAWQMGTRHLSKARIVNVRIDSGEVGVVECVEELTA